MRRRGYRTGRMCALLVGVTATGLLVWAAPAATNPGWSVVLAADPPGLQHSSLSAVSCGTTTACFAVGTASDGTNFRTLVERWSGTSWAPLSSPNPAGGSAGTLDGVSCTSSSACFAAG